MQKLKQKLITSTTITPFGFSPIIPTFGRGGYFGLPKPPLPSFDKSRRKPQRFKQQTRYQPSFTASALRITSPKLPGIVGVSVRPIIQSNKRRSKKRK